MVQYARIDSALYDHYTLGLAGDTRFYVEEARKSTGRVLELACGTGRITIPLAQAGINVVGVDLSPSMLAIARKKVAELSEEDAKRVSLVEGDMRSFYVDTPGGERFGLAMIPFR
ncbi:MAG: class I SAM-dependent methyltransferase, partial [Chloroflexi bacterium]|nr:class I SAM-dependent methyltransferase [Chloroflexota bacterium]